MRQQNESLDERSPRAAYVVFERRYGPRPRVPDDGGIDLPVPDQLATFTWLVRMPGASGRAEVNDVIVATLHNAMRRLSHVTVGTRRVCYLRRNTNHNTRRPTHT